MFKILPQNLMYAMRVLKNKPGFTAIAILTLALGIGSTTAIFSVVYATLFESMPYPKPDQLVMVWSKVNQRRNSVSVADYLEWKRRTASFQYLEAWGGATFNVSTADRPEEIQAALMTPGFFRMTGRPILLGRDFLPEEGEVGKDRVVMMSHRIWSQYFGSDPNIVGRQIRMNGEPYTVIGVTQPGMQDRTPSQLWLPLAFRPEQINHQSHSILVMGRLKDGVSIEQANGELRSITQELAVEFPASNANWEASVEPLQNNFIPDTTIKNLWLLLGAVSFLLLIACVNLANLTLARSATRQREVAIRAALGASRAQLFYQFMTESLVLSVAGGALGVLFGRLIIDGILAILPFQMLPSEADVRISIPVLGFTVCSSILAGLLFGCAPAMQASRVDLSEALKQGVRFGTWIGGRNFRRLLVVVEFAIALTLLASGGLALRSFWNLTSLDLGVQTDHVLTFNLPVQQARFDKPEKIAPYFRQLLEKVEQVPGVQSVAVTTGIPLRGSGSNRGFRIAGRPVDPDARQSSGFQMVTPGYFDAFRIRLIDGRQFNDQDTENTSKVAMINEAFAARFFTDGNPIGERIITRQPVNGSFQQVHEIEWTIVGIFHNTRNGDQLRGGDYPVIYVPFWQNPSPRASMAVRTINKPESLTNSLAATINTFDPDLPLAGVKTLDQILNESLSFDRFGAVLYGTFAAVALLLAAIGIYGVMSFGVAQRTREFGIRMALGAGGRRILRSVLEEGMLLAFLGLTLGMGCTYFVGRAMKSMLFGVAAFDFVAFGAVAIVLLATAMLACYIPARRASRVDPMISLRAE